MGTAELQKKRGVYPRAAVDVWVGGWVGHPGELSQGLENRKGERERQRVRVEMSSLGVGPYL